MKIENIAHWLSILGNLGLVVGLGLVIVQINQNSDLVREQLYQSRWTDDLNLHLALMGENPSAAIAKAIENPTSLTVEDARVLDAYLVYWSLAETRKVLLYQRGMTIDPLPTYQPGNPRYGLDLRVTGNAYSKATLETVGVGPVLTPRVKTMLELLTGTESLEHYRTVMGAVQQQN